LFARHCQAVAAIRFVAGQRRRELWPLVLICVSMPIDTVWSQPAGENLRASVAVASDYILHGLSQVDSGASLRLALDYEHDSGFFTGITVGNVGYTAEARYSKPREIQLDGYVGYLWRARNWSTSVALSRYHYPDLVRSYDYSQVAVTATFKNRYSWTAARISELLGVYEDAYYYRAGVAIPWRWGLGFEANIGRFESDGRVRVGYTYRDIGVSKPLGRLSLDLRFYDAGYGRDGLIGNRAGDLWVLSLSYVYLPRDRS
jgi:uncharacterized protein (TIGR02001 family)